MQSAAVVDDELGFELCYLDEAGSGHREPPASRAGLRPEGFHPVREFRWARGQGHLPGLWWSATTGAHVGHESWLERRSCDAAGLRSAGNGDAGAAGLAPLA